MILVEGSVHFSEFGVSLGSWLCPDAPSSSALMLQHCEVVAILPWSASVFMGEEYRSQQHLHDSARSPLGKIKRCQTYLHRSFYNLCVSTSYTLNLHTNSWDYMCLNVMGGKPMLAVWFKAMHQTRWHNWKKSSVFRAMLGLNGFHLCVWVNCQSPVLLPSLHSFLLLKAV